MIKNNITHLFLVFLIIFISFESGAANQQEEKLIQQNQEAAKSSTNQAMFIVHRIKCLNSNDRSALIACNKALSINPNAVALKNKRVSLSNKLNPKPNKQPVRKVYKAPARSVKQVVRKAPARPVKQVVRKAVTPKKPQVPKKTYRTPLKPIAKTKPSPKINKVTKKDNKKIITQVQQRLNNLGFNVGRPDGIAGKNTKLAIKNFQMSTRSKNSPKFDKNLLLELQKAQKHHDIANEKYKIARQLLSTGNLEEASTSINLSLKNAPWHKDIQSLKKELEQRITLKEKNKLRKESSEKIEVQKNTTNLALKSQLETKENLKQQELISLIELAQSQFSNKDIDKATSTINKALLINPNNEALLTLTSNIQNYKNEIQAKKEKDETLSILYARALNKFNSNELDSAIAFVDKGLSLESKHSKLLELKSKISIKLEENLVKKNKEDAVTTFYNKSLASFNDTDVDTAIVSINKGLSLDPNNLELLELKTRVFAKQSEIESRNNKDKKLTSLYTQASDSFNNTEIETAIATINQGLSLDSNNLKLLELKAKVIAKQTEVESLKNKNEKLASLFSQASNSLQKNQIETALKLVEEGLTLAPQKLNLLEIKRDILAKREELKLLEKNNQKIAIFLNTIEEKQSLLNTIGNKMLTEQQTLLNQAQQTLMIHYSKPVTSKNLASANKSTNKKEVIPKVSVPVDYKVNLASLPLNIGKHWVLDRDNKSDLHCTLSYKKTSMPDGQGGTQVYLSITKNQINFKTDATIDPSYEQTGISIDEKTQIPIETVLNEFTIAYKEQYQRIIEDMASARTMSLSLGFWPTWPVTQSYSANFELDNFLSAQQALMSCIKLQNEL